MSNDKATPKSAELTALQQRLASLKAKTLESPEDVERRRLLAEIRDAEVKAREVEEHRRWEEGETKYHEICAANPTAQFGRVHTKTGCVVFTHANPVELRAALLDKAPSKTPSDAYAPSVLTMSYADMQAMILPTIVHPSREELAQWEAKAPLLFEALKLPWAAFNGALEGVYTGK